MRPSTNTAFRLVCVALALAGAAFALHQSTGTPGVAGVQHVTNTEAYFGHAAVYGALAFFAVTSTLSRSLRTVLLIVAACALMGLAVEVLQALMPRRAPSQFDALANLAGAAAGGFAAWLLIPVWHAVLERLAGWRSVAGHS